MPGGVDERIVILDIDEKSLADPALGRWPWGRDKTAALVEKLFDRYGVALVGVRRRQCGARHVERPAGAAAARRRTAQGRARIPGRARHAAPAARPRRDLRADDQGPARGAGLLLHRSRRSADHGRAARSGAPGGHFLRTHDSVLSVARLRGEPEGVPGGGRGFRAFQLGTGRRRRHAPRADAGRIQGRLLREPVAGRRARADGLPRSRSRLSARALHVAQLPGSRVAGDRQAQGAGGRERRRAGAFSRAGAQLHLRVAGGRLARPCRGGQAEGAHRAHRHLGARAGGPARHAGGRASIRASRCMPT